MQPSFRQTLLELVLLVAAPTSLVGCGDHGSPPPVEPDMRVSYDPCASPQVLTRQIPEPPPAELLEVVRSCEENMSYCDNLCWSIFYAENLGNQQLKSCTVTHSATEHTVRIEHCFIGAEGRRPPGLAGARKRCPDATSAHLARAAFYEAASVHAFIQLARELRHHRAPRRLVHAVRRAAGEEITHARMMAGLARARGATPPPLEVASTRCRSLEAIAIENAREGLVGETWSAMLALWQAHHAPTAELRTTYAQIAADELHHAELAVELDAWMRPRLRPAARRRVEAERRKALAGLARRVRKDPEPSTVRDLGIPDLAATQQLFVQAKARLWSASSRAAA